MKNRPPQDDIIYLIMTDRFFDGDTSNDYDVNRGDPRAYHGGDLQGVIDKLDYIQSLGVTAIWLTPVMQNQDRGYHGYWITDFEKVDRHLGTLQTLRSLVRQAHQRGIKVLLDVVVNHTGPASPWATDPAKADWFHHGGPISDWNDQQDVENGQLFDLPDLAQENPAVADYLIGVDETWIRSTGVDGFRLDTVRHVPKAFWQRFARSMHQTKPGFFLMGEAWNDDPGYIAEYQKAGLDSLVDFPRQKAIQNVFGSGNGPSSLHDLQAEEDKVFPSSALVATFVDNHDMPRFVTAAGADGEAKLRAALAYLLTAQGIPIVYYGTEAAMEGGADPDNRRDMTFDANPSMAAYFKELTALRNSQPALRRGLYLPIEVPSGRPVLAYARVPAAGAAGDVAGSTAAPLVVAINTGDKPQQVSLTLPPKVQSRGGVWRNALGSRHEPGSLKGNLLTVSLEPYQAMALLPTAQPWFHGPGGRAVAGLAVLVAAVALLLGLRAKGRSV